MLQLSKSKKFLKDIEKFKKGMTKISKPAMRTEYEQLLKSFIQQCTLIDNAHSSEYNRRVRPVDVRENVIELARLRKKLNDLLN